MGQILSDESTELLQRQALSRQRVSRPLAARNGDAGGADVLLYERSLPAGCA